jgi:hypothetical protein
MNRKILVIINLLIGLITLAFCTIWFITYLKDKDSNHLVDISIWISLAIVIILSTSYFDKKKHK